jgi:hypothetical protein
MSRKEPELSPEDPQKKGHDAMNSTNMTTNNQLNGELNIDKLYPELRSKPAVLYENPYTINGGGIMKPYHFMSKPGQFQIHGRNPLDALRNGLEKLENENRNIYNKRKQISVNLQKENNNRENKLHKFMVKIFKIDHPVYRYKIELWKF